MNMQKLSLCLVIAISINLCACDWLVNKVESPARLSTVVANGKENLVLTNGLLTREFSISPDFATVDFYSHSLESSILRAINPEAVIMLDGLTYNIGGFVTNVERGYLNRTALQMNMTKDPNAFHYVSHKTMDPVAPYPYKPKRGAPKDITWPPKGLRLDVTFEAPITAPYYHSKVTVVVHYEIYVGIPLISKWISVHIDQQFINMVRFKLVSAELLSVNMQWGYTFTKDTEISGTQDYSGYRWLSIDTDQSHNTKVLWATESSAAQMAGSFQPIVNVSYMAMPEMPIDTGTFESFKVHELEIGSSDPERLALSKNHMLKMLAPQTWENPVFFHMTESSSKQFRAVVDQLAEVGFEMIIYSFGSHFNIESTDDTYIAQMTADIAYANSKGIEVGGYDLIVWTRRSPREYLQIDPDTNEPTGNSCIASDWYEYLIERFTNFINKTGLSMVETDGPYPGYSCASKNHSHHKGLDDSVYQQQLYQGRFFKKLREMEVYINQPDDYFYQGGNRAAMGYSEQQYSLPRWQDISVSRQGMYDDIYHLPPTAGWMFVPLVVYHGGGDAAMFEPLSEHLIELEWALAQYLGAGVAACYRGYRIYDTDTTKSVVQKWVSFYKKYRDILISDMVHVRRPDMQSIDSFMHVNPYIKNKGLAMVFNPTDRHISMNLTLPLYYTGLTDVALVSEQGLNPKQYTLDKQYKVKVPVVLSPMGITWLLVQ